METVTRYPRLIRRVRAILIDSVILMLMVLCWWVSQPLLAGVPGYLNLAIPFLMWFMLDPICVWRFCATPGHYVMGMRVERLDGRGDLNLLVAIVRSLLKSATGWWSFIFALTTKKHQALHDLLTGAVVILRNPETLPDRERLGERLQDVENFTYPSVWRRLLLVLVFLTAFFMVATVSMSFIVSQDCLLAVKCTKSDDRAYNVAAALTILCLFVIPVLGWRSKLYGARKMPQVREW